MKVELETLDSDDPTKFGGAHSDNPNLTPKTLREKMEEGYADPDNSLGDAPSVEDFCNPPEALDREKLEYAGLIVPTVGGMDQIYVTEVWYLEERPDRHEHDAFDELVDGDPSRTHTGRLWAEWHVEL